MRHIAEALLATERTRSRLAKVNALAHALAHVASEDPGRLPFAARFLSGTLLPTSDDRTLGVGGALVFEVAVSVTGIAAATLGELVRRAGDLGTAVGEALEAGAAQGEGLSLEEVEALVSTLAATGSRNDKFDALLAAFARCSPLEARYLARALLGEMRVGAKGGIVEEAIRQAFNCHADEVRRAAGLVSDVGELARLAFEDRLNEAQIVVGRPLEFMLATPIETARGADLTLAHAVEDKIDGIRAQAHISSTGVHLFARGKGSVTTAFPDVVAPLEEYMKGGQLPSAILDGELVVVTPDGRPRPFSALQLRLKKVRPDASLLQSAPVRYLVYDLLYEANDAIVALPFSERRARLLRWFEHAPSILVAHESRPLSSAEAVDSEFTNARARGFEGLVLKRLDAPYAAGVRGYSWLKVKKAFATLDVVVVAAERGHGKRAGVLSDYTYAIRDGESLLTVGKAYSGLTDAEIRAMTERLEGLATEEECHGYIKVRPEIVLEVAFDGVQRSERHSSGYALRFPRIERIRDDKTPAEIDTLETVRGLWTRQLESGHREELAKKPDRTRGRQSGRRPDVRQKSKQLKLFEDN